MRNPVPGTAGARLRELRRSLGLTQAALAATVGVSQDTISRVERTAAIEPVVLVAICCVHSVSRAWLERGEGEMFMPEPGDATAGPLKTSGALDLELLRIVLEGVEEGLEKVARVMPPDKKAELVAALYEMYAEQEVEPDKEKILRLIVSAA